MKSVSYITYNDVYTGIYQSQVIDVVEHLETVFKLDIELIAFVPARLWKSQKGIIKSHCPKARVYPILGSLLKWRRSRVFLKFIKRKKTAICRGPLAYGVAEGLFEKVIYDGRAAVKAEVEEYNVTGNAVLDKIFIDLEFQAVSNADFRIAVSNKLVDYWTSNLNIKLELTDYTIIPCTLTSQSEDAVEIAKSKDKIVVVYSGGTGPWQSFDKVVSLFRTALVKQDNLEVLFMTKSVVELEQLILDFPERVSRRWVNHSEVSTVLGGCDYGILIRDQSITNKVASPVKFAEYLQAGLQVLISSNLGDFTEFVKTNECGIVVGDELPELNKTTTLERKKSKDICQKYFVKKGKYVLTAFQKLVNNI